MEAWSASEVVGSLLPVDGRLVVNFEIAMFANLVQKYINQYKTFTKQDQLTKKFVGMVTHLSSRYPYVGNELLIKSENFLRKP